MERLIDTAAAEMDIDRMALRRRNQIRRQDLPYKTASEVTYDSGDFAALTKQAFELADGKGFARRKRDSARRGKLRGLGIGNFLGSHRAAVEGIGRHRLQRRRHRDAHDRHARFRHGPCHAVRANIEREARHSVRQNLAGAGRQRSRSPWAAAAAAQNRSCIAAPRSSKPPPRSSKRARTSPATCLKRRRPISNSATAASSSPAPTARSRSWSWRKSLREGNAKLPADAPQSLDVTHISDGPGAATFPNGCHVAEVEVDPETGVVEVVKYTCVNDFGIVVNPMIVAGQLHGGVVQGIGQALMEMTVYDGDGQLLTGSFMDYAMPRAADVPPFVLAEHPVPAKTNPLGVKGCGEAGCAGSLTSVMNAVLDALADRGIRHLDMPLTPFRIWQALQQANGGAGHPAR